ncbi:hypothetical protein H8711_06965 [Clostridiaceae bacterium NSJ-31]|uniref:Uncharacterized protein n=1 Tax=Ligaoa zhengdingensis TaxID=2763658 RepID=A0A926E0Q7_9FIRM|nr:hypothetical protein [Ligaoa zhengdingensis]MBC8546675.1 hypothetical protein [Ligaoa zhengdingensis]
MEQQEKRRKGWSLKGWLSSFSGIHPPKGGRAEEKAAFLGEQETGSGVFGTHSLLTMVAVVTLFLQLISFITTWNGARVYLGGVFFLAPLLFALAIQCTVYFLSNSLRDKIAPMRVVVLLIATACSTYYSYIGVYNTVNPPQHYLETRYEEISRDLTGRYDQIQAGITSDVRNRMDALFDTLTRGQTELAMEQARLESCQEELSGVGAGLSSQISTPNRANYSRYEDYVAAYNAYLSSVAQNSGIEYSANQQAILGKYGFESQAEFAEALASCTSRLNTLESTVGKLADQYAGGAGEDFAASAGALRAALEERFADALESGSLPDSTEAVFSQLGMIGRELGYAGGDLGEALARLRVGLTYVGQPLLQPFERIAEELDGGKATEETAMELKSELDTQVLRAISIINTLSPEADLSADAAEYLIHDLYLLPLVNLTAADTAGMARFCLLMAALIDLLTILFSLVTRRERPVHTLTRTKQVVNNEALFARQVYGCLMFCPGEGGATERLGAFLRRFSVSEVTADNGYSLYATKSSLEGHGQLLALLCQLNYARIIPAESYDELRRDRCRAADGEPLCTFIPGFDDPREEIILLRSSFQYWANEQLSRWEDLPDAQEETVLEPLWTGGTL